MYTHLKIRLYICKSINYKVVYEPNEEVFQNHNEIIAKDAPDIFLLDFRCQKKRGGDGIPPIMPKATSGHLWLAFGRKNSTERGFHKNLQMRPWELTVRVKRLMGRRFPFKKVLPLPGR